MTYICPVCGFSGLEDPPRLPHAGGGSYEICPSCGFQFGISDEDEGFTYEQWREKWISEGMPWDKKGGTNPPERRDPREQLLNVGYQP